MHTTLSGVDEKAPNEAPIRNDLPGLFVLLHVETVAGLLLECKVALHLSLVVYA